MRLILSVLGLPLLEIGFWAESTLWIVLEAALGCANLGGDEWGELGYISPVLLALNPSTRRPSSSLLTLRIPRAQVDVR